MRWLFGLVLFVHGLIHLMGFAKAFGFAALPQLADPISRPMGALWLLAALFVEASVVALFVVPRAFWILGAVALVASQWAIVSAWSDARFGTLPNVLLLLGVVYGALTQGPGSFRAELDREIARGFARPLTSTVLTEADLLPLPEPVQRYLRATGAVGQPRAQRYHVRFRGRIRGTPDARWMPFVAEQQSFADEPTRLFLMQATLLGIPVQAFHRLVDGHATMRVRVAGAYPMQDARGPEMDRSETVTLFNDMCILAPSTLADPRILWDAIDARTARAHFTHGAHTISATLFFDEEGLLSNFVSSDRSRTSDDGSMTPTEFSTPVRGYRRFGPYRLAGHGDAVWHLPEGPFVYGEFEMLEVRYDDREAR